MLVNIPESVNDYSHDRVVRSVVNHMLTQKADDFPDDLEWDELDNYYSAWLAARKVKVDHTILLINLWNAIWETPLRTHGITEQHAWPMERMSREGGKEDLPSLENCWENEWIANYYTHSIKGRDLHLYPQVYLHNGFQLQLAFSASMGDEAAFTAEINKDDSWEPELDEYNNCYTNENLFPIPKDSRQHDVTPLTELANGILMSTMQAQNW